MRVEAVACRACFRRRPRRRALLCPRNCRLASAATGERGVRGAADDEIVAVLQGMLKTHRLKLQPHQTRLSEKLRDAQFPLYLYWGMGSGKSIGGILTIAAFLEDGTKGLVICDKSVKTQWSGEVQKFFGDKTDRVVICHYEELDRDDAVDPRDYAVTVVDEAQRFRNAWHIQSQRMLHWVECIHRSPRVVFLSGTPLVHDPDVEMDAFRRLMRVSDDVELAGRVCFYDPRLDEKRIHHYAKVENELVECPMSWAQTFLYLQSRRQRFCLRLGKDDVRERVSSNKNSFATMLRSISNSPFPKDPAQSPKMMRVIRELASGESENLRQLVYSSRRDTGIDALLSLWKSRTRSVKRVFRVDGSMAEADRALNINGFNRAVRASVLFITDAGSQGIDCKRVDVVHILEPSENLQEERQTVNRAVRYKAHTCRKDPTVLVKRYISTFPTSASVHPPWKKVIYASGLFARDEMRGITRTVQYALKDLIRTEEDGQTVDERTLQLREVRDARIQAALQVLQRCDM